MKNNVIRKKKRKNLSCVSKPIYTTFAPITELENALNILNSDELEESTKTVKRNYCKPSTKKGGDINHMSILHYCSLIKKAILRQEWSLVMKLLIAFIDEPKIEKFTTGIILKYTLIYLLNDPLAHKLGILNEFLQLALSCQTATERSDFLKLLNTLPQINS